jgi:hypothetical protein
MSIERRSSAPGERTGVIPLRRPGSEQGQRGLDAEVVVLPLRSAAIFEPPRPRRAPRPHGVASIRSRPTPGPGPIAA